MGTDKAHIQHVAILEGQEPSVAPAIRETNRKLQVLAISISVLTLLLLVAVVLIWRRFQREKQKKQQVLYLIYSKISDNQFQRLRYGYRTASETRRAVFIVIVVIAVMVNINKNVSYEFFKSQIPIWHS